MTQTTAQRWPPDDIVALISALQAGDSDEWDALRRYVTKVARCDIASSSANPAEDAEDIAGAVCETLAKPGKLASYQRVEGLSHDDVTPREAFSAYLTTITHRKWDDRQRYARIRLDLQPTTVHLDTLSPDAEPSLSAPPPSTEQIVERRALLALVLARLEEFRTRPGWDTFKAMCLILSACDEVPYAQIAKLASCSTSQVRDAIEDMRKRLRPLRARAEAGLPPLPDTPSKRQTTAPPVFPQPLVRPAPPSAPSAPTSAMQDPTSSVDQSSTESTASAQASIPPTTTRPRRQRVRVRARIRAPRLQSHEGD